MIKLKNLLYESYGRELSYEDVVKLVNKYPHMKEAIIMETYPVYRGIDNDGEDYLVIDPTKYERVSRNTSNHYTAIMDLLNSWKKYPKRSRSLICSEDMDYASSYGTVYFVVPLQTDAIFGICPDIDLWESFQSQGFRLNGFNLMFSIYSSKFIEHLPHHFGGLNKEDFSEWEAGLDADMMNRFIEAMDSLQVDMLESREEAENMSDEEIEAYEEEYGERPGDLDFYIQEFILDDSKSELDSNMMAHDTYFNNTTIFDDWYAGKRKLRDILENVFDPEANNFELVHYYNNTESNDREVWTSSECLLISMDVFYNVQRGLKST